MVSKQSVVVVAVDMWYEERKGLQAIVYKALEETVNSAMAQWIVGSKQLCMEEQANE